MNPRNERLLIIVLALVQFTNVLDFIIMMPLGPVLLKRFNIVTSQFSLLVSAYTITAGISGFISAFFADKFDRKHFLTVAFAGFTVGTFACGLAPSYEMLLAARILTGMFGGLLTAVVLSILSDTVPLARRGAAMGILTAAFSVASVVGVPFGLWLADAIDWHTPFFMLGGIGLVTQFLIYKIVPPVKSHLTDDKKVKHHPLQVLIAVGRQPNQLRALLLMSLMMMGQFAIVPFLATFFVNNLNFTSINLQMMYVLGGLASMFTGPAVGRLADRIGKKKVFTVFSIAMLAPIIATTNLTSAVTLAVVLCISTLFFIFSSGRNVPAMTMITGTVLPAQRGSFMSINGAVQNMSTGLGSLIAGWIIVQHGGSEQPLERMEIAGLFAAVVSLMALFVGRGLRFVEPEKTNIIPQPSPGINSIVQTEDEEGTEIGNVKKPTI